MSEEYRDYIITQDSDGEWTATFRYWDRAAWADLDHFTDTHPTTGGDEFYNIMERCNQREHPTIHAISREKLIKRIDWELGTVEWQERVNRYWEEYAKMPRAKLW